MTHLSMFYIYAILLVYMKGIFGKKNIYLDYAGGTPIDKRVLRKMSSYQKGFFANPSAIYDEGVKVREIIEKSRSSIAKELRAHSDEIIFTGSGTESNALAIIGTINNYRLLITNENKIPHIITSNIEHPAVLKNFELLEKRGEVEVTYIKVDDNGLVNPKDVHDALKDNTILVSIMYANNEIGTIQPIEEIAKEIRHFKKNKQQAGKYEIFGHVDFSAEKSTQVLAPSRSQAPKISYFPAFHTDACQAMNYLFTENIEKLGVDLLSFNSSKIYGPKGIGVLYKKRSVELSPIYDGGGQEFGLRSGTENVGLIVGVSSALKIANRMKKREVDRLTTLRNYSINKILALQEETGYEIILNGDREKRLPNNINISISDISSELLVIELSARGISVSEKSACKSDDGSSSYVINAIRGDNNLDKNNSLRISLGRQTTKKDMDIFVSSLKNILEKYKKWN